MTSKEIVELLYELVDLKELINRGLTLKDINRFQDQLEKDLETLDELTKENLENEKLIRKFYRPFIENNITEEQFKDIVKQLENASFTVKTFEDVERQKIKVMLELDKYLE